MKIKVSEASGPVLDWMVAKAEGRLGAWIQDELRPGTGIKDIDFDDRHQLMVYVPGPRAVNGRRRDPYTEWKPSADWPQGGPIIERAKIHLLSPYGAHPIPSLAKSWLAHCLKAPHLADGWGPAKGHGPTPLIAAMRCFVTSKLGDEVEVPDELA